MPEVFDFPGPIPKSFKYIEDYYDYHMSLIKYELYQDQLSKGTIIHEPTAVFLRSNNLDQGTGKKLTEVRR